MNRHYKIHLQISFRTTIISNDYISTITIYLLLLIPFNNYESNYTLRGTRLLYGKKAGVRI